MTDSHSSSGRKSQPIQDGPEPYRLTEVQHALDQSISADETLSSICYQLRCSVFACDWDGWEEAHRECMLSNHYRLTASGCLKRMAMGDWHETLLMTLVQCLYLARRADRIKQGYFHRLCGSAPEGFRPTAELLLVWNRHAEAHLQEAMVGAQHLLGTRQWTRWMPET
ncbi:hypothetical protein JIR001_27620 [Polycladomyces abyssicola]|uniref:Uncharacterized protein n=1 Tax=Polycladomyces abyssicola TaxID=1125966 RepID=A0A8D5ZLX6_9BACL|nr:hypothetical protein [Polycladomyces abyssicola]BCU82979.1 hypothetical protein JIR001_27620 [Polycladomyces abyssicola]